MIKDADLIEFCQEAIRISSMSGHEEQVAKMLQSKMLEFGFDEAEIVEYGSVLGCIHGKRKGPRILMDGHIDTVDVIDRDKWSHDPFSADIVDGKIYGRGTSDMKGSDTAMRVFTS